MVFVLTRSKKKSRMAKLLSKCETIPRKLRALAGGAGSAVGNGWHDPQTSSGSEMWVKVAVQTLF